jgi:hypothetical protein
MSHRVFSCVRLLGAQSPLLLVVAVSPAGLAGDPLPLDDASLDLSLDFSADLSVVPLDDVLAELEVRRLSVA